MFRLVLQLHNGQTVTGEIAAEETLLDALRRLQVGFDAPCGGKGTCGKCRVTVLSGSVFPPAEQDGSALACSVTPRSDLCIRLPEQTKPKTARTADFASLCAILEAEGIPMRSKTSGYALGIDIGTTTVCAALLELQSGTVLAEEACTNAQLPYGADVISRMMEQEKPGGVKRLRDAILSETLCPLLTRLSEQAKIDPNDITRLCIAANTTMNHLLLGEDTRPIRTEPYTPVFLKKEGLHGKDLAPLPVSPDAELILTPNVGSYVGGDITAGLLAAPLWRQDEISLFLDLGTNGEIVLGNREFMLACACSAGPAFEGGEISCGMRAADGAIEAVKIEPDSLTPSLTVLGGGKPKGLCGSGLIDTVAELLRANAIDARGRFVRKSSRIAYDEHGAGRFLLAFPEESADGRELSLTETDIRCFIAAKGAVYSAIQTLLSSAGLEEDALEHIYIAGGIGSGIRMKNAVAVGMLPKMPETAFTYLGNTALSGACAGAISEEARRQIDSIADNMTYLDLSTLPDYMDAFTAANFLPQAEN